MSSRDAVRAAAFIIVALASDHAAADHPSSPAERIADVCGTGHGFPTAALRNFQAGRVIEQARNAAAMVLLADGGIDVNTSGFHRADRRVFLGLEEALTTGTAPGRVTVVHIAQGNELIACGRVTGQQMIDLSALIGVDRARALQVTVFLSLEPDVSLAGAPAHERVWSGRWRATRTRMLAAHQTSQRAVANASEQAAADVRVLDNARGTTAPSIGCLGSRAPSEGPLLSSVSELQTLLPGAERATLVLNLELADIADELRPPAVPPSAAPNRDPRREAVAGRLVAIAAAAPSGSTTATVATNLAAIARQRPASDHNMRLDRECDQLAAQPATTAWARVQRLASAARDAVVLAPDDASLQDPSGASRSVLLFAKQQLHFLHERLRARTLTPDELQAWYERFAAKLESLTSARTAAANAAAAMTAVKGWIDLADGLRPLVTHSLPLQARANTITVALGAGGTDHRITTPDGRVTLFVTHVPSGQQLSTRQSVRGPTAVSDMLLPILKIFISQLANVARDGTSIDPTVTTELAGLELLQPLGIQTLDLGGIERGHTATVFLCAAQECKAEAPNTLRNSMEWNTRPPHFGGLTFLLELGANFGQRAAFGSPSFAAVGPPDGDNQLYRLDYNGRRRNVFTVSLLAAVRFGVAGTDDDRFIAGFGPSFVPKSGDGLRVQFDVRFGVRLFTGAYFTAGVGLRRVEAPRALAIGATRFESAEAPPTLTDTTERLRVVVGVGFSVDLGRIEQGAETLVNSAREAAEGAPPVTPASGGAS